MKIKDNLVIAAVAVGIIWSVYLIDLFLPVDLRMYGIRPRQLGGLWGLIFSPFLHGGLRHITANTIPLFVLLVLALSYNRFLAFEAIVIIALGGGGLVWLFGGAGTVHIGASGIIFGLIGFLLFSGIFRRDIKALIVSLVVFFLYGGVLLTGFIPKYGVSWSGHAFGFLAGIGAAWLSGKEKVEQKAS